MTINIPVLNYPDFRPYTNIVPFTVRDGATYLLVLESLKDWIRDSLVPHVDGEIKALAESWSENATELIETWEQLSASLIEQVTTAIGDYVSDAEAAKAAAEAAKMSAEAARDLAQQYASEAEDVQDVAVATLILNATSDVTDALAGLYAPLAGYETLNATVATGRLSEETLDTRFEGKADATIQEIVETGRLSESNMDAAFDAISDDVADLDTELTTYKNAANSQITTLREGSDVLTAAVKYRLATYGGRQLLITTLRVATQGKFIPNLIRGYWGEKNPPEGVRPNPTPITIKAAAERWSAGILANAMGWSSSDGLWPGQISQGKILTNHSGNVSTWRASEGIAFRRDGSSRIYRVRDGDSMATLLADDVFETFGYSAALIKEGVAYTIDGTHAAWEDNLNIRSGRTILGQSRYGDVVIVCVEGVSNSYGVRAQEIVDIAVAEGLWNAACLDGGGSTQMLSGGDVVHISSDATARAVPSFILVNAKAPAPPVGPKRALPLASGLGGSAFYQQHGSEITVNAAVTGNFANSGTLPLLGGDGIPAQYAPKDIIVTPAVMGGPTPAVGRVFPTGEWNVNNWGSGTAANVWSSGRYLV